MQTPPRPSDESERLAELARFDILDTATEGEFDDCTRLASLLCQTQFSAVTLVSSNMQWFKSAQGPLTVHETTRDDSFCGHAIAQPEIFEIEDASSDERFTDNPLVTGSPFIRFYAAAPLTTREGSAIGTLCVFDTQPGKLTDSQREGLRLLAQKVVEHLESRLDHNLSAEMGSILEASNLYVLMVDMRLDQVIYTNPSLSKRAIDLPEQGTTCLARMFPSIDYKQLGFPDTDHWNRSMETNRDCHVFFTDSDSVDARVHFIPSTNRARPTLLILVRDKTEVQQYQSEVEIAHAHLKMLNNVAIRTRNPVVITDHLGLAEWVNPAFEALTGYRLSEVQGRRPGAILGGPATSAAARERIGRHIREGLPVTQEILNYSKNGRIYWLELDIQPVRDETGQLTHFVAIETDVTQRKEQEENYRLAKEHAEQANRAKSQFLANISHELRTPLNGILGMAELIQSHDPETPFPHADTLLNSARHLVQILNDLLDLSHIESGLFSLNPAPFALLPLLEEIVLLFQPEAKKQGSRLVLIADELEGIGVEVDATRLKQVLMNLVNNAIKFAGVGEIRVAATISTVTEQTVTLDLSVQDDGPGISSQDAARIFETFERGTAPDGQRIQGTGLGLSISRHLLELMGAELSLSSQPGEGACFYFQLTLPRVSHEQPQSLGNQPQRRLRHVRALVVDDNATNREVLRGLLEAQGIQHVTTASSCAEALTQLEVVVPDVIFLDIQMPEVDGFQCAQSIMERVKKNPQRPRLIACTAQQGSDFRETCLAKGFDDYLIKPVTRLRLRNTLSTLDGPTDSDAATAAWPEPGRTIDLNDLSQSFGDNNKLLQRFLNLFLTTYQENLDTIRQNMDSGALQEAAITAHSLKGQVGYFGESSALYHAARHLEQQLRAELSTASNEALDDLVMELEAVLPEIENLIDQSTD